MTLKRLSGLDTAFLAAERPGNPLHMMGAMILDPSGLPKGYSFETFRDLFSQHLDALGPMRRRLVEVPGGLAPPFWLEDTQIDLDEHLRRAAVPSPGGPHEIAAMAREMLERPLERDRPLWEMVMVEGLAGGRLALLAKLHHAMMDGIAGVKLMASLFSPTPEVPAPRRSRSSAAPASVPGGLELLTRSVPWLLEQPWRAADAAARTARSTWNRAWTRARLPQTPELHVPRSWLNVPITARRTVAYQSLPLKDVKHLAHAAGATVNDVTLSVVAGALRRYLEDRGGLPEEALVAGIPMATRTNDDDDRANAITSVSVGLATDLRDPAARLRAIRDAMAIRKQSRGSTVGGDLAAWADVPSPFVFSLISQAYIDLHIAERMDPICNLVVSNVPGPPKPLYLFGSRLVGIYPLGPIYSGLVLNVTALSYCDSINFGFVACGGRMPDLWDLVDGLPVALEELAAALDEQPQSARKTGA